MSINLSKSIGNLNNSIKWDIKSHFTEELNLKSQKTSQSRCYKHDLCTILNLFSIIRPIIIVV